MKITTIVTDAAINFADCNPTSKDIILDVFNRIFQHENVTDGNPDDFEVVYSNGPMNGGSAFITSKYGTYILHDLRVEEVVCDDETIFECTIAFYSLLKISDHETISGVLTAPAPVKSHLEQAIEFATQMVQQEKNL